MRNVALAAIGILFFSHSAAAAPAWSAISFTVQPLKGAAVVAAADALMASEVGKEFPGRLLLQAHLADGTNPATHTFVPVYKTAADREAFVQKLEADAAWSKFLMEMEKVTAPVSATAYRTVKSWGDIADTDHVWMVHAVSVRDPAAFVAAIDKLMASPTGQKFPGQVHLSSVVAGGLSPVTHTISVGYASEAEMDAWIDVRNASAEWATYVETASGISDYLGASMARDVKTWGSASLAELVMP